MLYLHIYLAAYKYFTNMILQNSDKSSNDSEIKRKFQDDENVTKDTTLQLSSDSDEPKGLPLKKQLTQDYHHLDALENEKANDSEEQDLNKTLENFRKEAIWRQMKYYKNKFQDQLSTSEKLNIQLYSLNIESESIKPLISMLKQELEWIISLLGDDSIIESNLDISLIISQYFSKLRDLIYKNITSLSDNNKNLLNELLVIHINLQRDNIQASSNIQTLTKELEQERSALQKSREDYFLALKKIEKLKMVKSSLQTIPLQTTDHDDKTLQLENAFAELQAERRIQETRLAEINRLSQEILSLTREKTLLEQTLAGFPPDFKPFLDIHEEYTKIQQENESIKNQLEQQVNNSKKIQNELSDQMQDMIRSQSDQRQQYQSIIDQLKDSLQSTTTDKDNYYQLHEQMSMRINGFTAQIKDLKQELDAVKAQSKVFQEKNKRLSDRLNELLNSQPEQIQQLVFKWKEEESLLMNEIETIAEAFESIESHNASLIKSISVKEELYAKLLAEKNKLEQILLKQGSSNTNVNSNYSDEYVQKLERKEKELYEQMIQMRKDLNDQISNSNYFKKRDTEDQKQKIEQQNKIQYLEQKVEYIQRELQDKEKNVSGLIYEKNRLIEEVTKYKVKLDVLYSTGQAGLEKSLQEQLVMYRQLVKCLVCNKNDKEVCLSKCMHVFCRECIDSRLATRQRKCPTCGESFSQSEVKTIYL